MPLNCVECRPNPTRTQLEPNSIALACRTTSTQNVDKQKVDGTQGSFLDADDIAQEMDVKEPVEFTLTLKPALPQKSGYAEDTIVYYTFKRVKDQGTSNHPDAELTACTIDGRYDDKVDIINMITGLFQCCNATLNLCHVYVTSHGDVVQLHKLVQSASAFTELTVDYLTFHKILNDNAQVKYMSTAEEIAEVLDVLGTPNSVELAVHQECDGFTPQALAVPDEVWSAGTAAAAAFIHAALVRAEE